MIGGSLDPVHVGNREIARNWEFEKQTIERARDSPGR
jgi:hypothetical protein